LQKTKVQFYEKNSLLAHKVVEVDKLRGENESLRIQLRPSTPNRSLRHDTIPEVSFLSYASYDGKSAPISNQQLEEVSVLTSFDLT
jgi:hypothetical protein